MMLAIDTNILVRYITRDDPVQERKARELFLRSPVFVPKTVLMETEWVLRFTYGYSQDQIAKALAMVVGNAGVQVEDEKEARLALEGFGQGLDLADAFHLAASCEVETFVTFDKPLCRRAKRVFAKPVVVEP